MHTFIQDPLGTHRTEVAYDNVDNSQSNNSYIHSHVSGSSGHAPHLFLAHP